MRIDFAGNRYELSFKREVRGVRKRARVVTIAIVRQWEVKDDVQGWGVGWDAEAVAHPGDTFSKEEGRQAALAKLKHRLPRTLAGKVMQAYYTRPHPRDPQFLQVEIKKLEKELAQVLAKG